MGETAIKQEVQKSLVNRAMLYRLRKANDGKTFLTLEISHKKYCVAASDRNRWGYQRLCR